MGYERERESESGVREWEWGECENEVREWE